MTEEIRTCQLFYESCNGYVWGGRLIHMKPLSGPISDRLRKQLDPDDPSWTPQRPPIERLAVPKDASGHTLGRGPDPQGNDLTGE